MLNVLISTQAMYGNLRNEYHSNQKNLRLPDFVQMSFPSRRKYDPVQNTKHPSNPKICSKEQIGIQNPFVL